MKKLDSYVRKAKSMGVTTAKIIDVENIIVGNWVRLKCQYGCRQYGKWLTCPPFSPTPNYTRKMLSDFSKALLMYVENISFKESDEHRVKFKRIIAALEREIFLDGYYKAFGMTAGPCRLCRTCDTSNPCLHPYDARPSLEACGIDVYQTAKNCGLKLEVVKIQDSLFSRVGLIIIQ